MKLLKTKVWCWYDISLLKWCCFLFGMVAGAYFTEFVKGYAVWFIVAAILFAVHPTVNYFKK